MEDYSNATKEERTAALEARGLSLKSTFVPFSRSRNAKPGKDGKVWRSLNWKVTLSKGGRELLTTDYGQGEGHAPTSKKPVTFANGKPDPYLTRKAIEGECENGKTGLWRPFGGDGITLTSPRPIPGPTLLEVCYSLAMDAQSGQESFSDFCANFGYDEDSRKVEETWRTCADTYRAFGADLTAAMCRIVEGY